MLITTLFKSFKINFIFLLIYQLVRYSLSLSLFHSNCHFFIDRFNLRKELFKFALPSAEDRVNEKEKESGKIDAIERLDLLEKFEKQIEREAVAYISRGHTYPSSMKVTSLSSVNWEEIKRIFNPSKKEKPTFDKDFFPFSNERFEFFLNSLKERQEIVSRVSMNERRVEFFIEPILILLARAFKDLKLDARTKFTSKILPLNGFVDFSFIQSDPPKEYFIVEVKKEEERSAEELLQKAMAQMI